METQNYKNITNIQQIDEIWQKLKSEKVTSENWDNIDWKKSSNAVKHLRRRIFVATQRLESANSSEKVLLIRKLQTLQKQMLFSYPNLIWAVRRITQLNKGKNTPGLDNFFVKTKEDRFRLILLIRNHINIIQWNPAPVKRLYIPKANSKLRPLGIPTLVDRIIQAIYKSALEPEWEAKADIGSYGFRPGRSCHDAIERIFTTIKTKDFSIPNKSWILEADIKGCFDNLNHDYLMEKVNHFPGRTLIHKWLKAGYVNKNVFHETDRGSPQGGIISPLLANIVLDGLESEIHIKFRTKKTQKHPFFRLTTNDYLPKNAPYGRRSFVRYADDFVVFCEFKEDALKAKIDVQKALEKRGLQLSKDKTLITHLSDGFDFLGTNVRHYQCHINDKVNKCKIIGYKPLIKPSNKSVKNIREKLKFIFLKNKGKAANQLIAEINPIIRGWANYHRPFVSRKTFEKLDAYLFQRQLRYAYRMHGNKGKKWAVQKYFGRHCPSKPNDKWVFGNPHSTNQPPNQYMLKFRWTTIERHHMIPNGYSHDDPALKEFWIERIAKGANCNIITPGDYKIAAYQRHICPICENSLYNNEEIEKHHIISKKKGGLNTYENLVFLHKICHQSVSKNEEEWVEQQLIRNFIQEIRSKYSSQTITKVTIKKRRKSSKPTQPNLFLIPQNKA
eukprot:TRINITY_DN3095_c0_g1_i1.p1 TRINITY_DN3095_c0_g1~~TRINITY_DN3095_c0_g1_i1.p1  ORF type:complete len:672 (+),score=12.30 TRINITY_DN3095_c0_g1_i1:742-2757(+)